MRAHSLSAKGRLVLKSLPPNPKYYKVVLKLDEYVVGQAGAKKAVAIALRNRWRRHLLPTEFQNDVIPKNILMVGPTGCGKTEVARRLSILSEAPFIKVEATKFTEVGFHGKDVDQIIKDLVEVSIKLVKKKQSEIHRATARENAEKRILKILRGSESKQDVEDSDEDPWSHALRNGELDDNEIEIEVPPPEPNSGDMNTPNQQQTAHVIFSVLGQKNPNIPMQKKKMSIKQAMSQLEDQELSKLMDNENIISDAIKSVENDGIVFIDEIDKICGGTGLGSSSSADASAEGVQRDLLPLIEGSTISTKHGNVNTDHILFIASGAFHTCKPSDLLAELQGRLPIRVKLDALTEDDMYRILTEPVTNLIRQQVELLATEEVTLEFKEDALREIARIAVEANRTVENIGARRLHALIEKIVEEISFEASNPEKKSETIVIDKQVVTNRLEGVLETNDLSRHIL